MLSFVLFFEMKSSEYPSESGVTKLSYTDTPAGSDCFYSSDPAISSSGLNNLR
jgi:hypothetical protein